MKYILIYVESIDRRRLGLESIQLPEKELILISTGYSSFLPNTKTGVERER